MDDIDFEGSFSESEIEDPNYCSLEGLIKVNNMTILDDVSPLAWFDPAKFHKKITKVTNKLINKSITAVEVRNIECSQANFNCIMNMINSETKNDKLVSFIFDHPVDTFKQIEQEPLNQIATKVRNLKTL